MTDEFVLRIISAKGYLFIDTLVCVSPLECRNGNKEFPYYEDTASFVFLWNYDTVISSGINHPGMAVLPWE